MKTLPHTIGMAACVAAASLTLSLQGQIFTDNFNSGASALWGNESGAWSAAGGVYQATAPLNAPMAISSLPFSLTDFSFDVDVNNVADGGICLRSTPMPNTTLGIAGVFLVVKSPNFGYANSIYWQTSPDGNTMTAPAGLTFDSYTGNNVHVHVVVSGNTYEAFLNGSATPATSLITSAFSGGQVALYDNSGQSFDNVVLVPEPSTFALMGLSMFGIWIFRRRK